jgi:hypothetical protein
MIQVQEDIKEWFKTLTPQEVFEDTDCMSVTVKQWQGSNKFEGKYLGKVKDSNEAEFLAFHKDKEILLYGTKDLTVGQWNEIMKLPDYGK